MEVSIVIPFLGRWDLVHQRINEIYRFVSDPVEIILVNDFSQDEIIDSSVAWWQQSKIHHTVTYVKNEKNLGFGGSMNKGCATANGDVLILLSNDVIVRGDLVKVLLPEIRDDALFGHTLYNGDTGWNVRTINGKRKLFMYLSGHLLACKKYPTWQEIGGFDPIYGKFDVEDIDLSTTAIHIGYDLVPLNFPVQHISGQTIRKLHPNREKFTLENLAKFDRKWSELLEDE